MLIENDEKESKMEFKFFAQYDHQLGNVPEGASEAFFSMNSTFRINLFRSVWLPLTVKYDTDNKEFLVSFSVTTNLGN